MKCPLISSQYGAHNCVAPDCGFTDEAGHCLVKQALQCYVSAARTKAVEEEDRIRRETELAKTYWAMKKDGTRTPIQFLQDGDITPIQYAHQPIDTNHPHGGVYEDLTPLRDNVSLTPEVQLQSPRMDESYINF